jgi:excisionase family DNA binding protein
MTGRLYSCREAAKVLDVSDDTIRRLIHSGKLEAIRIGRRCLRVLGDSIETYIDTHSETNRLVCQGETTWSIQTAKPGSDGGGECQGGAA